MLASQRAHYEHIISFLKEYKPLATDVNSFGCQIGCQKGQENTLVQVLQKRCNQGIGLVQWFDLLVTLGLKTLYCDVILFRKSRLLCNSKTLYGLEGGISNCV